MNKLFLAALACSVLLSLDVSGQTASTRSVAFKTVPELPYTVVNGFFRFPKGMALGKNCRSCREF